MRVDLVERMATAWRIRDRCGPIGSWYASDTFRMKIAWLMPRWLVYWCAIRLIAHATSGEWSHQIVPDLKAMDALERWEKSHGL